jgi:2',3'-cyclic-nucleotide 2'-phosphodiesterase
LQENGIDFFTSGNHIFKTGKDLNKILSNYPIIRPANYDDDLPGVGYKIVEVGVTKILVVNLIGQVFLEDRVEEKINNPFKKLDEILLETKYEKPSIILLDFHAEATSEKKSMGAFVDGKINLLYGTHTHVQTADEYIMPEGTGYITDVGMVGVQHSSLGMEFENIVRSFVSETKLPKIVPQHGLCLINGIFAKIKIGTGEVVSLERFTEYKEI